MAVYEPQSPELGKNAIQRRVNALRAMNNAGGTQYTRYDKSESTPSYVVRTVSGVTRRLGTREVPAYVAGHADSYDGVRAHMQEALDDALSDPTVTDRTSLVERVLERMDDRCGNALAEAVGFFSPEPSAEVA